jgi:hypothetical protein
MEYLFVMLALFVFIFLAVVAVLRWILRINEIHARIEATAFNTAQMLEELRAMRQYAARADYFDTQRFENGR